MHHAACKCCAYSFLGTVLDLASVYLQADMLQNHEARNNNCGSRELSPELIFCDVNRFFGLAGNYIRSFHSDSCVQFYFCRP